MAANTHDVIMLFGDSMITPWGWGLGGFAQRLAGKARLDVKNRGLGGYQTNRAVPVFEQVVQLLSIWFGVNDAAPFPSRQHVLRNLYKENLKHLVNMVTSPTLPQYSLCTRIILITLPPVNSHQRQDHAFDATKSYAEAMKELGTALILFGKDERAFEKFLFDGLHLSEAGYEIKI
ncbi:SGNH hydrolase-type esterase domain-containing protein [Pisolithus marmoratus]|nr:SGNH hydrolase-type esterase domain-containing protein [Pisolithus marmoratus]